jgi:hypothetical protein
MREANKEGGGKWAAGTNTKELVSLIPGQGGAQSVNVNNRIVIDVQTHDKPGSSVHTSALAAAR